MVTAVAIGSQRQSRAGGLVVFALSPSLPAILKNRGNNYVNFSGRGFVIPVRFAPNLAAECGETYPLFGEGQVASALGVPGF